MSRPATAAASCSRSTGWKRRSASVAPYDWFFYVDGVEATVGAADYSLHGGESVWWDYRDWTAAMQVPAVVGSWPQPFLDGYDGKRRPVVGRVPWRRRGLRDGAREAAERRRERRLRLARRGDPGPGRPLGAGAPDPAAAQIEGGPQASGVFAEFRACGLAVTRSTGLGEDGKQARAFGAGAGLVAATRRYEEPPVWVVTGATPGRGAGGRRPARPAPTCATITRSRSKAGRRRRCRCR